MATTFKLIDKAILTSSQTTISFTGLGSLSSTYNDLKIVYSARSSNTNPSNTIDLSFNSTTTNFTNLYLQAAGTSPASGANFARYSGGMNSSVETSNTFSNGEIYIPNFSSSSYKAYIANFVYENNSSGGNGLGYLADLWANTSAITSISLTGYAGDFVSESSFYLYGIKNS
jgi:hypothetical protein